MRKPTKPIEQAWQKPMLDELDKDKKIVDWIYKEAKGLVKGGMKINLNIDTMLKMVKSSKNCAYCGEEINWINKPMLVNIESCPELFAENTAVVCNGCRDTFKLFSLNQVKEMRSRR